MELTDTHCHLFLPEFNDDRSEVMSRAFASGINRFFLPNVDSGTLPDLLEICKQYPKHCFPMVGLHPTSVEEDFRAELDLVYDHLSKGTFVAVGEIGIDLYWDLTYQEEQTEAFQLQLKWASELNLPAVIHLRNSFRETISAIEKSGASDLKGIFHCFTGTVEEAKLVIDLGFYLGIGGVATFKNAGMEPLFTEIGLEHMVLETDSPYLAPVPRRGKRNEPAYLRYIAMQAASLTGRTLEEVASITTHNSKKIFCV